MRLIIIIVLAVLVLLTLFVPLFKKKKPSLFTVVILLIPAVALGYFEYNWTQGQEELQKSFRSMTETTTTKISCERMSVEWFDAFISLSETSNSGGHVSLKHSSCAPLLAYQKLEDKNLQEIDNSFTASVIAFSEAGVRMMNPGIDSEKSRCSAIKQIPKALLALGGTERQAYMIQQHYKKNMQNAKLTSRVC